MDQQTLPTTDPQVELAATRAAGLRALAELIEAEPALAGSQYAQIDHHIFVDDPAEMAALVRRLGGARKKEADETYLTVVRELAGRVAVKICGRRNEVCERVVVGTETVEVPDPDAPKITVEREVVEWKCAPVLVHEVGIAEARQALGVAS